MSAQFELYIDGACQGNPGEASVGIVIYSQGKTIKTISKPIGQATNNIAEYSALIFGLQEALILKAEKIKVSTDSELLFRQLKGDYKIKNPNLKFLNVFIQHLCEGFKKIDFCHIPRSQNREADQLATKALKKEQTKMVAPMFTMGEESPSSKG